MSQPEAAGVEEAFRRDEVLDWTEQTFRGLHLEGGEVRRKQFEGCTFERCTLRSVRLVRCLFVRCRFVHSDLSVLQLDDTVLDQVRFAHCKLVGADWTGLRRLRLQVGFETCVLDHGTFDELPLGGMELRDCTAHDVSFAGTDLRKAVLAGSDLAGSLFERTDLREADLREARNLAIDPSDNRVRGARLSLPEAMGLLEHLGIIVE